MVVHVAHDEHIPTPLKCHAVFRIDVCFKDTPGAFHRMASQSRMVEVPIEQAQRVVSFSLYDRG